MLYKHTIIAIETEEHISVVKARINEKKEASRMDKCTEIEQREGQLMKINDQKVDREEQKSHHEKVEIEDRKEQTTVERTKFD